MKPMTETNSQDISSNMIGQAQPKGDGVPLRRRITRGLSGGAMFLLTAVCVWGQLTAGELNRDPDLSSPEATVRSFTKAAVLGEAKIVQACFLPGGEDYDDIRKVMEASPGTPAYEMKAMLAALDTEGEMPIVKKAETQYGMKVVWRVTFKREFKPGKGPVFKVGSTYDLDATLKKSGNRWLIDNF